ncbi:UNVERIFIED_CONTAM: hypothetical protein K2H54_043015 [Gekko kuhli]
MPLVKMLEMKMALVGKGRQVKCCAVGVCQGSGPFVIRVWAIPVPALPNCEACSKKMRSAIGPSPGKWE